VADSALKSLYKIYFYKKGGCLNFRNVSPIQSKEKGKKWRFNVEGVVGGSLIVTQHSHQERLLTWVKT
jgi:hypothetical protein